MNIQSLLIENNNRPEVQQEIREAAVKGAADAGFNLIIGYDNRVKCGTEETFNNFEAAIEAAVERVKEVVNLD